MKQSIARQPGLNIGATRKLLSDLFTPRQSRYWFDFLATIAIGGIAFVTVPRVPLFSPLQILAFVVAVLAYYRASLFTHELTHLPRDRFKAFRVVWNLFCGIPFLMPSYTYYPHLDHHRRKHYGTEHDGEYLPLGTRPFRDLILFLLEPLVFPILAVLRFGLFTPISWLSPALRRWLHRHASSMVIDLSYVRKLPQQRRTLAIIHMQEMGCFLFIVAAATLWARGVLPADFPVRVYLIAVCILMFNHVRTLGAHRYMSRNGEMTFEEQLLDSVNFPNSLWTAELWAPLGLRYHALHHLFPSLPYHNLGQAHARLMAELPADSPYRLTERPNLRTQLGELLTAVRRASRMQRRARASSSMRRADQY
ncbi:MAG: fatty acid desaturase [Pirellulales bacterium]